MTLKEQTTEGEVTISVDSDEQIKCMNLPRNLEQHLLHVRKRQRSGYQGSHIAHNNHIQDGYGNNPS